MADRPLTIDIKHARILKSGDLFLITDTDGNVPLPPPGFGLFYKDCRYLSRYELSLGNTHPLLLMSAADHGFAADIVLTNAALKASNESPIHTHMLGINREHVLIGEDIAFIEAITFRNFSLEKVELPFSLSFSAGFESIFVLRGTPRGRRGTVQAPECEGNSLRFGYLGADAILRSLEVRFSMTPVIAPRASSNAVANFTITLGPQQSQDLIVSFNVCERQQGCTQASETPPQSSRQQLDDYRKRTSQGWLDGFTQTYSRDRSLNHVLRRSLSDLRLLRIHRDGCQATAAGVPWFVGLFGRDSLIPSLQCLAFDPQMSVHVARLLAQKQGHTTDRARGEEPGKILHEFRVGEMAHLDEVHTPSYASIDSTLLFLILVARHASWSGDLALFNQLRGNVERALQWIAEYGDRNGDGYIEYWGKTDRGAPVNQGWKDSEDGIVREDGSFPEPPISLVEVQGYAYFAKTAIAALFLRAGEKATGEHLIQEAEELRVRFNRDFWMDDKGCYCLALEGAEGRQVSVIASNAGQALWTGIADPDKALRTAERLMREDMFGGWGVRTLSDKEVHYNPFAYQLGSVWPFDNSLILAGFRRYGLDDDACRIFRATLDAAERFPQFRLPEFFAGTRREEAYSPAHCPRSDPLQAWSAGAVPYMIAELLGLQPDAFDRKLRIVRPVLPESINHLELHGIRVADATVDLRFTRELGGAIVPQVLAVQGELRVDFENSTVKPGSH